MKKFSLVLLCLFSFGFSQDREKQAMGISLLLEEEESVAPDVLRMDVSVNARGGKEGDVVSMLGEVDRAVRGLGFDYSGGNYWVQKNCWWEEGKRKCKGYVGEVKYSFRLQRALDQNKLLDLLDAFKEKFGESVSYAVSQSLWMVSPKRAKGLEEELRFRLLERAKDFAAKAGKRLGKDCYIQSVSYEHVSPIRGVVPYMALKSSTQAPEPKMEEVSVSVRASVSLVCR
ncbi:MAG: SIMPL domain-containing protein [Aquificaceae bacterium]